MLAEKKHVLAFFLVVAIIQIYPLNLAQRYNFI